MVDSHYELQCGAESLPEQTYGFDSVLQGISARDTSVLTVYKHTSTVGHQSARNWCYLFKEISSVIKTEFYDFFSKFARSYIVQETAT